VVHVHENEKKTEARTRGCEYELFFFFFFFFFLLFSLFLCVYVLLNEHLCGLLKDGTKNIETKNVFRVSKP